ncbi:MAG: heterodisulfide reductase-related iron-sulfur binding cluster [Acidimicrobiales bacterium]
MTTTYDPKHPRYYDEGDLRQELTRVYDLCHGCRLCFNLCPSFPSMFDAIDAHDGDVEALSEAEQDKVVAECYQCKLCYVKCPYIPPHEWALDFPRLMLRAEATTKHGHRKPIADQVLGRTDLLGKLNTTLAPVVNAVTQKPGTPARRVMAKTLGLAAERLLPPYAKQRFSTWFKKRTAALRGRRQATVALFPTCFVEYNRPDIGQDLVKVYEHNGVECQLPPGMGCCGAPWLHAGDFDNFEKTARRNLPILAQAIRRGQDVVVPQPTCGYVLKKDYAEYLGGPDAELLADHVFDASEYLVKLRRDEATELDTEFGGEVPDGITYHVSCHLQAQNIGLKSRDLMKLTGTRITLVNKCSGIDGTWGYRAENYDEARKVAGPLADGVRQAGNAVVAGDCTLANGAIEQETGNAPQHPIQVIARAYGIAPEPGAPATGPKGPKGPKDPKRATT